MLDERDNSSSMPPNAPSRPISTSSRQSSFADNLDQLAFINFSAHRFPAASTSDSVEQAGRSSPPEFTRRPTRSTPSSPRLAPLPSLSTERRAISRPNSPSFSRRNSNSHDRSSHSHTSDALSDRRRRARSWVHAPGAAFTPTASIAAAAASSGSSNSRIAPRRQVSSPGTSIHSVPASNSRQGRMRSTSAAGISPPLATRRSAPVTRQRQSSSARTSPVVSPLQPLTPAEQPPPHRTHSVPQLARISPMVYGFGFHYASREDLQLNGLGLPEGYFALPPSHNDPTSITPLHESSDVPPPYTPSQANLHALSMSSAIDRPVHSPADQDEEDEEGILSFSTQSRQSDRRSIPQDDMNSGLRRRREIEEPVEHIQEAPTSAREDTKYTRFRLFVVLYILHPLRLLAAVPGCIGTFWLLRNAILLAWSQGSIWQQHDDSNSSPCAIEFGMASLWSMTTAYHANSFTTLLLRRWVHYYSILSSFIRLIALQAICWPLVRITLHVLGPKNPLASWVIISTTTALSDTIARWVVSNITTEGVEKETQPSSSTHRNGSRKRRKRTSGATTFWRAIMGGPSNGSLENSTNRYLTESEADSDADIYRYRLNSADTRQAIRSQRVARIFHWDVAFRRNALPIAVLSFLSLLALLLEQVQQRA
jgi:hypothetical protein